MDLEQLWQATRTWAEGNQHWGPLLGALAVWGAILLRGLRKGYRPPPDAGDYDVATPYGQLMHLLHQPERWKGDASGLTLYDTPSQWSICLTNFYWTAGPLKVTTQAGELQLTKAQRKAVAARAKVLVGIIKQREADHKAASVAGKIKSLYEKGNQYGGAGKHTHLPDGHASDKDEVVFPKRGDKPD